jgi:cytochrome c oxidase subunit 2
MVADEDLKPYKYTLRKNPRLLTVDNYVLLPVNKNVRLLVTSADVIHS